MRPKYWGSDALGNRHLSTTYRMQIISSKSVSHSTWTTKNHLLGWCQYLHLICVLTVSTDSLSCLHPSSAILSGLSHLEKAMVIVCPTFRLLIWSASLKGSIAHHLRYNHFDTDNSPLASSLGSHRRGPSRLSAWRRIEVAVCASRRRRPL